MQSQNQLHWVDYLRSTITILVIAHHAALAYTTFSFFDKEVYIRSTYPIVDKNKNAILDIFVNFNDLFFMQLMFLIAGLFLIKSISKKGKYTFFKDRLYRLAVPFLLLGTISNLIAYYPAHLLSNSDKNLVIYLINFFTVQQWPVGPPWFIWVLFVFNFVLILIFPFFEKNKMHFTKYLSNIKDKPFYLVASMFFLTSLVHIPFLYVFEPYQWTGFGPFDFQISRIILYFSYFLLGSLLGFVDFNTKLLGENSIITKKWKYILLLALLLFTVITRENQNNYITSFRHLFILKYLFESLFCVTISLALLGAFKTLFNKPNVVWKSLSDNAYIMYLIHFPILIWLQYVLMNFEINALFKFSLTFTIGSFLSWSVSVYLRKIPLIHKYL